jgi:hypothetical protein
MQSDSMSTTVGRNLALERNRSASATASTPAACATADCSSPRRSASGRGEPTGRRRGPIFPGLSQDFQTFPSLLQGNSKHFPWRFPTKSKACWRLRRFLPRPSPATACRRRASIFQPITTSHFPQYFVFPKDNAAPTRPGQANEPGRDLRIAALGLRRWSVMRCDGIAGDVIPAKAGIPTRRLTRPSPAGFPLSRE